MIRSAAARTLAGAATMLAALILWRAWYRGRNLLVEELLERESPGAGARITRIERRVGLQSLEGFDDTRRVRDRLAVHEQNGQARLAGGPQGA
jgi:hypothetical protein